MIAAACDFTWPHALVTVAFLAFAAYAIKRVS